jgi:hypothetical protein
MLMGEVGVTVKDGLGAGWAIAVHPKQSLSATRHRAAQTKPIWFLPVRRHADTPQPASPDDSATFMIPLRPWVKPTFLPEDAGAISGRVGDRAVMDIARHVELIHYRRFRLQGPASGLLSPSYRISIQ